MDGVVKLGIDASVNKGINHERERLGAITISRRDDVEKRRDDIEKIIEARAISPGREFVKKREFLRQGGLVIQENIDDASRVTHQLPSTMDQQHYQLGLSKGEAKERTC